MPLNLMDLESSDAERLALAEEVETLRDQVCALESRIADLEAERDA